MSMRFSLWEMLAMRVCFKSSARSSFGGYFRGFVVIILVRPPLVRRGWWKKGWGALKKGTPKNYETPNYSWAASVGSAVFFSLPRRYRHSGQLVAGQRRTSVLLPQQQSRHLRRIARPLVILSSIRHPPDR